MAQINLKHIEKIEKERNTIHEKVHTTYTVFEIGNEKFIQFDTYGKTSREHPEKISQSLQLDKETAEFLVDLLTDAFNLKYSR